METLKKKCTDKKTHVYIYDMEKLYGRLLEISQKRDVTLERLLPFELAPLPPALFDDYGDPRKSTKLPLLHKLADWNEKTSEPDFVVMDGNEMLYHITWSETGTVHHPLDNLSRAVERRCQTIFDRYDEGSTKTVELLRRVGGATRGERAKIT